MKKITLFLFLCCSLCLSAQYLEVYREPEAQSLQLYPNPVFGDEVNLVSSSSQPKDVTVYDVFGKVVLRDRVNSSLVVSRLVPGVYVLRIKMGKATINRKLIVK